MGNNETKLFINNKDGVGAEHKPSNPLKVDYTQSIIAGGFSLLPEDWKIDDMTGNASYNYTGPRKEEMGPIEFTPGEVVLVQAKAGTGLSRYCAGHIVKQATELHGRSVLIVATEEQPSYMQELIATSCDVDNINVQVMSDYNEAMNALGGFDVLIIDNIAGNKCKSPDTNGEIAMDIISDIKRLAEAQHKACILLGQLPEKYADLKTPELVDQHVVLSVVGDEAFTKNITTGVTHRYKCDLEFSLFEREGVI